MVLGIASMVAPRKKIVFICSYPELALLMMPLNKMLRLVFELVPQLFNILISLFENYSKGLNQCLTAAKVFRISEKSSQTSQDRDYTKCAAYKACDQPTLWPTIVSPNEPPTTPWTYCCPGHGCVTPEWKTGSRWTCPGTPSSTTPTTTPATFKDPDLPSWSPLTNESEIYSEYECFDDHPKPDHRMCTLGIVVQNDFTKYYFHLTNTWTTS